METLYPWKWGNQTVTRIGASKNGTHRWKPTVYRLQHWKKLRYNMGIRGCWIIRHFQWGWILLSSIALFRKSKFLVAFQFFWGNNKGGPTCSERRVRHLQRKLGLFLFSIWVFLQVETASYIISDYCLQHGPAIRSRNSLLPHTYKETKNTQQETFFKSNQASAYQKITFYLKITVLRLA